MIQKEVFDKVGYFDERIKYAEDSDMWFRIIATYPVAFYDRYMAFYQYDAENRALNHKIMLQDYLPFYVNKYKAYKENKIFYAWINRWSANIIRRYYFDPRNNQIDDAKIAAKKLDYTVIPFKYKLLFKMPHRIAKVLNELDILYHQKRK